jgi:hypothetical protein
MSKINEASWHRYADTVLGLLPQAPTRRPIHKSFNDVFKSSRLASIPRISKETPSFFARHQQYYPQYQVISSFNAAHRRGDWGLKRPLPPVKDSHIIVSELDTEEYQTTYDFATEKPRFVRRMKEFGLVLSVPIGDTMSTDYWHYMLSERQSRRPRSPLEHLHPQWNRTVGNELGPRMQTLSPLQLKKFLRWISGKRAEFDSACLRLKINDPQSRAARQLAMALFDIPLNGHVYQTHPTAGLTYSAKGWMPSTPTGTRSDLRTTAGGSRNGRPIPIPTNDGQAAPKTALVYGIVARLEKGLEGLYDRSVPVELQVVSAHVTPFGRVELTLSPFFNLDFRQM